MVSVIEALTPSDSRQLRHVLDRLEEPDRDVVRAAASLREQVRTLDGLTSALKAPGQGCVRHGSPSR